MTHFEIERKFLIRPLADVSALSFCKMEQTYLLSEGETRRIRKTESLTGTEYFYTEKKRVTARRCVETERKITKEEYLLLWEQRDMMRQTIRKVRYYYPFGALCFEIDRYPFWKNQWVLEVELEAETQEITFPPDITVIREVTDEYAYKNAALALKIPKEDL